MKKNKKKKYIPPAINGFGDELKASFFICCIPGSGGTKFAVCSEGACADCVSYCGPGPAAFFTV